MTAPVPPPGWRAWPCATGRRFARRVGSAWADVLEDGNGWAWRVTVGVHVFANGRRIITAAAFAAADRVLVEATT